MMGFFLLTFEGFVLGSSFDLKLGWPHWGGILILTLGMLHPKHALLLEIYIRT
jgi:hypothetical protein